MKRATNFFSKVTEDNAVKTLYTITIFTMIIYLSMLYGSTYALTEANRLLVQAVYNVGISVLIAIAGLAWLSGRRE